MSALNVIAISVSRLSMAISGRTIYKIKRDDRRGRKGGIQ